MGVEDFSKLAKDHPEFTIFCENSGIATDTGLTPMIAAEDDIELPRPAKKAKTHTAPPAAKAVAATDDSKLPREKPMWLVIEDALPEQLDGFMPETLAICT